MIYRQSLLHTTSVGKTEERVVQLTMFFRASRSCLLKPAHVWRERGYHGPSLEYRECGGCHQGSKESMHLRSQLNYSPNLPKTRIIDEQALWNSIHVLECVMHLTGLQVPKQDKVAWRMFIVGTWTHCPGPRSGQMSLKSCLQPLSGASR